MFRNFIRGKTDNENDHFQKGLESVQFFLFEKNLVKTSWTKIGQSLKGNDIETGRSREKSVCFDFRSTNVGSSVIKTGRSEGSLL